MGEHAFGTLLLKGGIGGDAIAEVTNIGGPNVTRDEVEVTHHQSTDMWEEVLPSIKRSGEITVEGNFVPGDADGQIALMDDFAGGVSDDYAIVFPDALAAAWEFSAWVKSPLQTGAPVDGKVPFTATLRITGAVTLGITMSEALGDIELEDSEGAVTLVPAFAGTTHEYSAVLAGLADDDWIDVTVTGDHEIRVNGNLAVTTSPYRVALGGADSLNEIVITHRETDCVPLVYTLTVAVPA